MRHISPLDPFAHFCEGTALGKSGRLEEASISLIKALLLGWSQQRIFDLMITVHQQLSGDLSAVVSDGAVFKLNLGNPFVRKHMDQAVIELIQELIKNQHQTVAKELRDTAVGRFGCSESVLDDLLK